MNGDGRNLLDEVKETLRFLAACHGPAKALRIFWAAYYGLSLPERAAIGAILANDEDVSTHATAAMLREAIAAHLPTVVARFRFEGQTKTAEAFEKEVLQ